MAGTPPLNVNLYLHIAYTCIKSVVDFLTAQRIDIKRFFILCGYAGYFMQKVHTKPSIILKLIRILSVLCKS